MLKRPIVFIAVFAMVGLAAHPAMAVSNYSISERTGTFLTLSSNSLFSGVVDDQVVKLSTSASGALHLPFPVHFYGHNYTSLWVSSNGNVQFGGTGNTAFTNDCLPSAAITGKFIAVFWDDLIFDTSVSGRGVFTKTQGSGAGRRFTISWQVVRYEDGDPVLAQLTFFQQSNTIKMVYGDQEGESATIGVQQSASGLTKQFACNTGLTNTVFSGLRIDFIR